MQYAMGGITALLVTLIICHSIILVKSTKNFSKPTKAYRIFIFSLIVFYLADILWGIFEYYKIMPVLYADTVLFFLSMAVTIFLWTRYVTIYVGAKGKTGLFVLIFSALIVASVIIMLIINVFNPIFFLFNENKEYEAKFGRFVLLMIQEVLFVITAFGGITEAIRSKSKELKTRFYVMSLFSIAMIISIIFQALFPLLPVYSIGCMLGICLVNSFVVDSEKEENRKQLAELLAREIKHQKELDSTKALIYIDSLTGAQSKFAYVEMEERIDKLIAANLIEKFAVVVFDVNGLKHINDTEGHEAGDKYIKECYDIITEIYKNQKIYRFGGDEFVIVLENEDYDKRFDYLVQFENKIDVNLLRDLPVVSTGMADFDIDVDNTYRAVFIRADKKMYERKKFLKSHGSMSR